MARRKRKSDASVRVAADVAKRLFAAVRATKRREIADKERALARERLAEEYPERTEEEIRDMARDVSLGHWTGRVHRAQRYFVRTTPKGAWRWRDEETGMPKGRFLKDSYVKRVLAMKVYWNRVADAKKLFGIPTKDARVLVKLVTAAKEGVRIELTGLKRREALELVGRLETSRIVGGTP